MADYAQFCPVARAAEILGQRWNLLILRELFVGPQRFSDLRRRLGGDVSSSVLAARLSDLEAHGIVRQEILAPPAAATVYTLTPDGEALWPSFRELTRWGVRFLLRRGLREGDHLEPDWVVLGLRSFARSEPTPERRVEFRIPGHHGDHVARYQGGPAGTRLVRDSEPVEATLRADPLQLLPIVAGVADPGVAVNAGLLELDGDLAAARDVPLLFEVDLGVPGPPSDASVPPNP